MILQVLAKSDPSHRFTPYALAQELGISAGSATAAVKRLIEQGRVVCYGVSPLIIGKAEDAPDPE